MAQRVPDLAIHPGWIAPEAMQQLIKGIVRRFLH
jgi:hypothetical protein